MFNLWTCWPFAWAVMLTPPLLKADEPDVPYIQTPQSVVLEMLDMAELEAGELLVDLGSGDGRIPILAAREFQARGHGIEIDPDLVALSRRNADAAGVSDSVTFETGDLFEADFSDADVITLYLLPELNLRLRPTLLEMRPGTRIVSHEFDMGNWSADETRQLRNRNVYLWIVPAQLAGEWLLQSGERKITLSLTQDFQKVEGHATVNGESQRLESLQLHGDKFRFALRIDGESLSFHGKVEDDGIHSLKSKRGEAAESWSVKRLD